MIDCALTRLLVHEYKDFDEEDIRQSTQYVKVIMASQGQAIRYVLVLMLSIVFICSRNQRLLSLLLHLFPFTLLKRLVLGSGALFLFDETRQSR